MMTVLRKDEDDWWYARHSDGRVGSIPVPYVEVVSRGEAGVQLGTSELTHLVCRDEFVYFGVLCAGGGLAG